MRYCDNISEKNGYISVTDKFLRYKSDRDFNGWLLNSFIKLYQNLEDTELENEWRNGPIYSFEINFEDNPLVNISIFKYKNITDWNKGISPASHWHFYHPVNTEWDGIQRNIDSENILISQLNEKESLNYWGLEKVYTISFDLIELNSDNIEERIFKKFNLLKSKE